MASMSIRETINHALADIRFELEALGRTRAELTDKLAITSQAIEVLEASRDRHGEMLDALDQEEELEERRQQASHDVDVCPPAGIVRPLQSAIMGYDRTSWGYCTTTACNLIETRADGRFDGMDSEELELNFRDWYAECHFVGVRHGAVNWVELARYFGSEE